MAPPTSLTFRLRGCDAGTDRKAVQDVLVQAFDDISANDVHIRSLATTLMPWEDPPTKTATLNFTKLPSAIERCLSDGEWTVEDAASNNSLILDTHFLGLTPLNDVRPERHDYDCIAISGLASHPFGSWQPKSSSGRSWMWIRDALPGAFPNMRTILFGYDTKLVGNTSFQTIADLGSFLAENLKACDYASPSSKPLLFLAHSLGGIVLKETLDRERDIIRHVAGAVFFSTPSRGMDTQALMTMVEGQPTAALVHDLATTSDYLQELDDRFFEVARRGRMEIFWAYETKTSPTVAQQNDGSFARTGPIVRLVTPHSATRGLYKTGSTATFAINENHSDMVKFRQGDTNLHIVLGKLKQICATHGNILADQPQHQPRTGLARKRSDNELQKKKSKILRSLYTSPYRDRKERNPDRVPGTCEWFVSHDHFRKWRDSKSSTMLWVSADPGCGKSVLAKYLIDSELPTSPSRTTCYFFFKDDFEDQRSGKGAISCLLHQLFVQKPALFSDAIIQRFDTHGERLFESFLELWETLLVVSQDETAGEIVCILDAFDECEDRGRSELTRALCKFFMSQNKCNLKFLLTSRPFGNIRRGFQPLKLPGLPVIHLKGESDIEAGKISKEIDIFIRARVEEIRSTLQLRPDEAELLLRNLMCTPQRTYLWAYLTLNLVQDDINIDKAGIERVTSSLPQTVDDAYERLLAKSHNAEEARKLLSIVVAAARPLTLTEMGLALAIRESHKSSKSLELMTEKRFQEHIRDICGLFVVVIDSKIYLLHQTAKEFLVESDAACNSSSRPQPDQPRWKSSLTLQQAHKILWRITSWYLGFPEFRTGPLMELSSYLKDHFFLDYSANSWATHFRFSGANLDSNVIHSLMELCEGGTWFRVYWATNHSGYPLGFTRLMIASYFGIKPAVTHILRRKEVDVDYSDETHGRSALSWAAQNGHSQVVKLLIKGRRGRLRDLARFRPRIGAEIDSVDGFLRTPLSYAVLNRHLPIVEMLLKAGARVDHQDKIGGSPMSYAICSGDGMILRLLKDSNTKEAESASQAARRLLFSAVSNNDEYLVERLLETELVDVNSASPSSGMTPLHLAIDNRNETIVRLLLDTGRVDVNATCHGEAPITVAILRNAEPIVRLLLETDKVVLGAAYEGGETPLSLAIVLNKEKVVQLLLLEVQRTKNRVNDPRHTETKTPLALAVEYGCEEVVGAILAIDVEDINITDEDGKTPLHLAAENGETGIVRRLLNTGVARIDTKCRELETPFSQAVKNGHKDVVQLLLGTGEVDVKATDLEGRTPILWALDAGQEALVGLLLGADNIDPDTVDLQGRTALFQAVKQGDHQIVQLLLDTGKVDVHRLDVEDRTALSWAAGGGGERIVRLLLQESSLYVDRKDCRGRTPLLWAARNGHIGVVRILLFTKKVDIHARDEDDITALTYILRHPGGHELLSYSM